MGLSFIHAELVEQDKILSLLRIAALSLQKKGVDQWKIWLNPPEDKIQWVENGLLNNEFFFIQQGIDNVGMVRLSKEDEIYWGKQIDAAYYIHSLVILPQFSGNQLGEKVLDLVMNQAIEQSIPLLRLDCIGSNQKLCSYYENQGFVKMGEKQMPHSLNNLYEKQVF